MAKAKDYLASSKVRNSLAVRGPNFLDISVEENMDSQEANRRCVPLLLGTTRVEEKGISWLDVPHGDHSASQTTPNCKHCNMQVTPAASRAWHERVCGLNMGHRPGQCELCQRPFVSMLHARNHYLYGCSPV